MATLAECIHGEPQLWQHFHPSAILAIDLMISRDSEYYLTFKFLCIDCFYATGKHYFDMVAEAQDLTPSDTLHIAKPWTLNISNYEKVTNLVKRTHVSV